jgi:CBS domain-containing protein
MKHVSDVMTTDVVAVEPDTPFKELVTLLRERGLSALPVIDPDRKLVGIVSEADLILRHEYGYADGRRQGGWRHRRDRVKAEGETAARIMTTSVVTIDPEATVASAARLMHRHGVKRLPVVDPDAKLLGIVSRTDLLKIYLRIDGEIRDEVEDRLCGSPGWIVPGTIDVLVEDGIVSLEGRVEQRSQIPMLLDVVASVDGVVAVRNRLGYEVDDETPGLDAMSPWASFGARYGRF